MFLTIEHRGTNQKTDSQVNSVECTHRVSVGTKLKRVMLRCRCHQAKGFCCGSNPYLPLHHSYPFIPLLEAMGAKELLRSLVLRTPMPSTFIVICAQNALTGDFPVSVVLNNTVKIA